MRKKAKITRESWVPADEQEYAQFLSGLRNERRAIKAAERLQRGPRQPLGKEQRQEVLDKTAGRCHICGGVISGAWEADHVLSHSKGGSHSVDNYLPAHRTCNNYRWDYTPAEFQEIMKLGIWVRNQIEKNTLIGTGVAKSFVKHEARRISRRKAKQ
jgi:5-methylcytosine-specific restriction endonuclease McrA